MHFLLHHLLLLLAVLLETPDLVFEVLHPLLELITLLLEKLDMIIGLSKLPLQILRLLLGIMKLHQLWIDIFGREIRDQRSSRRIIQRGDILFNVSVTGREACHHESVGVASQTLLQELGQLTFSIGDKFRIISLLFCKSCYYFSQNQ